ncbi:Isochorismatase domain-containing protein [Aphelenchoides besseyi]|nr:Isochorismatase domain-containing protein [Aphelenchoides besseyi]
MCRTFKSKPLSSTAACSMDFSQFVSTINSLLAENEETSPSDEEILEVFEFFDKDNDGRLNEQEAAYFNNQIEKRIRELRSALVVVDFQNDFIDGTLGLKYSEAKQDPTEIIEPINNLLHRHSDFDAVVYTLDWHPEEHISFYEYCRNEDRELNEKDRCRVLKPFSVVKFDKPNREQTLYPIHCIENTYGAALHKDLQLIDGAYFVYKGTNQFVDSYSAFMDNQGKISTNLNELLMDKQVDVVFIVGVALDVCVYSTARDGAKLGYLSAVVSDCSRGISEKQIEKTQDELARMNVPYVDSRTVHQFLDDSRVPWSWIRELIRQLTKEQPVAPTEETGNESRHSNEILNGHPKSTSCSTPKLRRRKSSVRNVPLSSSAVCPS